MALLGVPNLVRKTQGPQGIRTMEAGSTCPVTGHRCQKVENMSIARTILNRREILADTQTIVDEDELLECFGPPQTEEQLQPSQLLTADEEAALKDLSLHDTYVIAAE